MTVEEFMKLLKKHDQESSFGGAYLDAGAGCIDGYFHLEALVEELNAMINEQTKNPDPKVVEFKPVTDRYSEDVVALLEKHLEAAKRGEYVGAVMAFIHRDGDVSSAWSASDSFSQMLGALHRLSYVFNKQQDEQPD